MKRSTVIGLCLVLVGICAAAGLWVYFVGLEPQSSQSEKSPQSSQYTESTDAAQTKSVTIVQGENI